MPLACYKMDRMPFLDNRKMLLHSAILIALSENYHGSIFEIFGSNGKGFFIRLNVKMYNFSYDRFEIEDNILYEFDNEKEHIVFLRKRKIKQLNIY